MHTQIYELYRSGKYNQAGDLMKQHLDRSLQYALSHLKEMKKE